MCRVTENNGLYQSIRDRLKIKAFYLRLSVSKLKKQNQLPESLTLIYLPRINESPLEINDSKIRSDSSGFLTLYRMRSEEEKKRSMKDEGIEEVIYGSREKVKVSEGVRFEVYSREEKILKGIYRKDIVYDDWKLESKCILENDPFGFKISEAEIFVSGDGNVKINEKIEIVLKRIKRTNNKRCFKVLEEIPENSEEGEEKENESDDGSCCCCCAEMIGSDFDGGEDCLEKGGSDEEGTWAVDVGIWVMCLGVGYLVSKASSRTLRRRRMMFR